MVARRSPPVKPVPVLVKTAIETMGERVATARRLRGLSQESLAHLSDVGVSTVRALEAGAQGVSLANVFKVLSGLGLLDRVGDWLDPLHDPEAARFALRAVEKS